MKEKKEANLTKILTLTIYLAYSQRWMMETILNLYNNKIDCDTVNVHTDYRVYATEIINYLSVIITTRVKNEIVKKEFYKDYYDKQIFRMLSKYKKVRTDKDGLWEDVTKLKYIEELIQLLNV